MSEVSEKTRISLGNAVWALAAIAGIVFGYSETVGDMERRLATLETNRTADKELLSKIDTKLDALLLQRERDK